jgi:uncharacterized protein YggT (Ycf19 family)
MKMKIFTARFMLCAVALCLSSVSTASASVFLPHDLTTKLGSVSSRMGTHNKDKDFSYGPTRRRMSPASTAMAIPGYGLAEQVFVGGFANFLQAYNLIITARVLLSWVPQAQGIGALQPIFAITDPYLNLFRGIIPPIGGLDLSPLAAFFLLNVLTNATAALGADLTPEMKKKLKLSSFGRASARGAFRVNTK